MARTHQYLNPTQQPNHLATISTVFPQTVRTALAIVMRCIREFLVVHSIMMTVIIYP